MSKQRELFIVYKHECKKFFFYKSNYGFYNSSCIYSIRELAVLLT